MSSDVDPRERAARALCEFYGQRPDADAGGRTMWQCYLEQVDVVLLAAGFVIGEVTSANDN